MIASLIIILHLMGIISIESATTSLYIAGILLIIAEIGVVSFGVLALNGALALYAGYALQHGSGFIFGLPIGWSFLFAVTFIEVMLIATVILVHRRVRNMKSSTGRQGMIGQDVTITKWDGAQGLVRFEGEDWKAISNNALDLNTGEQAIITDINKLTLIITTK